MLKKEPIRVVLESLSHPVYKLYSRSERRWGYCGMQLYVKPGIFHPGWFVTSVMLLEMLETIDVTGSTLLEMGCGSGALACRAAKKGAVAAACDITKAACLNAELNAKFNTLEVEVIQSDLFDQMDAAHRFEYIFVNPPFKPKYPEKEDDFAFCCGEEYEYYISLFSKLRNHLMPNGRLFMALAKSCDVNRILGIAQFENVRYDRITEKRKWSETNYLYSFSC